MSENLKKSTVKSFEKIIQEKKGYVLEKILSQSKTVEVWLVKKDGKNYVLKSNAVTRVGNNNVFSQHNFRAVLRANNEANILRYLNDSAKSKKTTSYFPEYLESFGITAQGEINSSIYPFEHENVAVIMITEYKTSAVDLYTYYKNNIVNFSDSVKIMYKMVCALETVHKFGVAHCDIKLANFLGVKNKNTFRIFCIDFEYASVDQDEEDGIQNFSMGTPNYYPPEYAKHETMNDFTDKIKRDIWALGVCYHWMLLKRYPWRVQKNLEEQLTLLKNLKPIKIEYFSPEGERDDQENKLIQLIEKMLAIKPYERCNVKEIKNTLLKIIKTI